MEILAADELRAPGNGLIILHEPLMPVPGVMAYEEYRMLLAEYDNEEARDSTQIRVPSSRKHLLFACTHQLFRQSGRGFH